MVRRFLSRLALLGTIQLLGLTGLVADEPDGQRSSETLLRMIFSSHSGVQSPEYFIAGVGEVADTSDCQRKDDEPLCAIRIRLTETMVSTVPEMCSTGASCDLYILNRKQRDGETIVSMGEKWLLLATPTDEPVGTYGNRFLQVDPSDKDIDDFRIALTQVMGK